MISLKAEDPNRKLRISLPVKFIYWLDSNSNIINNMESNRTKWLMEHFPLDQWLKSESRILDLACGMGYISNFITTHVKAEVWGIDVADYRTDSIKCNTKYNFLIGDSYKLPFNNGYFDAVNIFVSLHHMWEPESAIREALRVLKSGGKLIILEDLIKSKYSRQTLVTLFIDNVINLSFKKNPNTNKTKEQWLKLLTEKFNLKLQNEYSIKWGPLFRSQELGLFLCKKG